MLISQVVMGLLAVAGSIYDEDLSGRGPSSVGCTRAASGRFRINIFFWRLLSDVSHPREAPQITDGKLATFHRISKEG